MKTAIDHGQLTQLVDHAKAAQEAYWDALRAVAAYIDFDIEALGCYRDGDDFPDADTILDCLPRDEPGTEGEGYTGEEDL